jgi:hypothetical protein
MLVLATSATVGRAQTLPAASPGRLPSLWSEAALSLGPYVWHATSTYVSTDEPEPARHQERTWTMLGGAIGISLGGWLGEHIALGGTLRIGLAAAVEPSELLKVSPAPFFAFQACALFSQQQKHGWRLLLSGGVGALLSRGTAPFGPAAGFELGYAFSVQAHVVTLGLGGDLMVGFASNEGEYGRYEDRDLLVMPGASVRLAL